MLKDLKKNLVLCLLSITFVETFIFLASEKKDAHPYKRCSIPFFIYGLTSFKLVDDEVSQNGF